jgi:predicted deacylase
MITVGSASAEKGAMGKGFLKVGELSVHSEIVIPVLIVNGGENGPTLWINGAVHGDEINGFMATRRVALGLDPKELRGALVCTPICNPLATQWRHTINPYDFLNLDQQFPGNPEGLYSQQVAYHLFQEVKKTADYLINFHTAATHSRSNPYTVYKNVPGVEPEVSQETERVARVFGTDFACKVDMSTAKGEPPGGVTGNLDVNCLLQGIPAFMAEVGQGGRFEEGNITFAEKGIGNVMKHLEMIPGEIEVPRKQTIITKRRPLCCKKAGFLIMDAEPGTIVSKGNRIAHTIDLFSEVETFEAQEDTFIILVRDNPIVHTGDRVAFIGLAWEEAEKFPRGG